MKDFKSTKISLSPINFKPINNHYVNDAISKVRINGKIVDNYSKINKQHYSAQDFNFITPFKKITTSSLIKFPENNYDDDYKNIDIKIFDLMTPFVFRDEKRIDGETSHRLRSLTPSKE